MKPIKEEWLCSVQDVVFKSAMISNSAGNAAQTFTARAKG
jgi:hypothetical protein